MPRPAGNPRDFRRLARGLSLASLLLSSFVAAQAPSPSFAPRQRQPSRSSNEAVLPRGGPVVVPVMTPLPTANRRATTTPLPVMTTATISPRPAAAAALPQQPLTTQPRALAPPPRAVPVPVPGVSRRMLLQQQPQQLAAAPSPASAPPPSPSASASAAADANALSAAAAARAALGAAATSCAAGSVVLFAAQQECGSGLAGAQIWRATRNEVASKPKPETTILGLTLAPGALLYALDPRGASLVVPSGEGAGKGTALRGPYQLLLNPPWSSPSSTSSFSSNSSSSLSWTSALGFLASGAGASNAATGERPPLAANTRIDPLELTFNGRECRPLSLTVEDACVAREKGKCGEGGGAGGGDDTCKVVFCCALTATDDGSSSSSDSSSLAVPTAASGAKLASVQNSKGELLAERDFLDSSSNPSSPLATRWRVLIGGIAAAVAGALALVVCVAIAARARAQREASKASQRRERQLVAMLGARTLGASKLAAAAAAAAAASAAARARGDGGKEEAEEASASPSSSSSSRSPRRGHHFSPTSEIEAAEEEDPEMGGGRRSCESDDDSDDDDEARSVEGFPSSSPSPSAAAAAAADVAAASASAASARKNELLLRRWPWSSATVAAAPSAPSSSSPPARAAAEQQQLFPSSSSPSPLARGDSSKNTTGSSSSSSSSTSASQQPPFDPELNLALDPATELKLGKRLGSGSFGIVYECDYRGRRCACKLLKAHIVHELCEGLAEQQQQQKKKNGENGDENNSGNFHDNNGNGGASLAAARTFAREISILASLPKHPRVVSLFAACLRPPTICLVEELVEGGSLADAIKVAASGNSSSSSSSSPSSPSSSSSPPSSPTAPLCGGDLRKLRAGGLEYSRVLRIGADVAAALAHLHARKVTHSDLKPGNILLDREGRGKVVDFGVSRIIAGTLLSSGDCGSNGQLQANDTVAGATPAYAAPEQFEANRLSQAPSIDVWALGIVLNEAFTGRRHLDDVSQPLQVIYRVAILRQTPRLSRRTPPALEALLRDCWEIDPLRRPTAAESARRLEDELARVEGLPRVEAVAAAATAAGEAEA